MKFGKTPRGFALIEFDDAYGKQCSLQKSSLASDDAVWLGIDDAEPIIMASNAAAHGVKTDATYGWVPYPVPDAVQFTTRMHLAREQVGQMIPLLQHFVETGELPENATIADRYASQVQTEPVKKPVAGNALLQQFIDSLELFDGVVCYDYEAMYAVRDALNAQPEPVNQQTLVALKAAKQMMDWNDIWSGGGICHQIDAAIAAAEKEQGHD